MLKTFGAMLGLVGLLAAPLALASGVADRDASDPQAECAKGCREDSTSCQNICKQQAGEMVGRCAQACKTEQRACEKECTQPKAEDGQ